MDKVHIQYQDAATVTQTREEAAERLFQILSAEVDYDDFEDEDPDFGDDDECNEYEEDEDEDEDEDDADDDDDDDVNFSEDGGA